VDLPSLHGVPQNLETDIGVLDNLQNRLQLFGGEQIKVNAQEFNMPRGTGLTTRECGANSRFGRGDWEQPDKIGKTLNGRL